MDETFKTAHFKTAHSRLFAQVYTIHGSRRMMNQGNVERQIHVLAVVCLYALLPTKTRAVYERVFPVFHKIKTLVGTDWMPTHIMIDFEKVSVLAAQAAFPDTIHNGCFFHFCQSIYRRLSSFRLLQVYQVAEAHSRLKQLASLAFMPPNRVLEV